MNLRSSFNEQTQTMADSKPEASLGFRITETPVFPLNYSELFSIAIKLFRSTIPTSIGQAAGFVSVLICLRFVGKYGSPSELAGATLGNTWSNVFCLGIFYSINQGFCIHAAQLYGAKKYYELGVLFQKNLCVLTAVMIPAILSLFLAETILISLGLSPEISIQTGLYLRNITPSLISLAYFDCTKFYLIAQNIFYVHPIIQGLLSLLQIVWCHLFVVELEMPLVGVAIAKSITDISALTILWTFIKFSGICSESWISWDRACLDKWLSHLKRTIMIGGVMYIEWISYEVSVFIASALNDEYVLGAHGVAITLTIIFFMLPVGNSLSLQAYVGNAAGEGLKYKAQKYMTAGLSLNALMVFCNIMIMTIWKSSIAEFFTNDPKTMEILQNIITIYSVAHMADTSVNHLTGILRTLGNEKVVLLTFCFCYIVVGLNCEWLFGIVLEYGYMGIWLSIASAMFLMFGLMIRKLYTLDWDKEIAKVQERINEYHKLEERAVYIELVEHD